MPAHYFLKFPPDSFVRETEKAKCFLLNDQYVWMPKSQIEHIASYPEAIEITLPEWLVIEKGLEIYADEDWVNAGFPD